MQTAKKHFLQDLFILLGFIAMWAMAALFLMINYESVLFVAIPVTAMVLYHFLNTKKEANVDLTRILRLTLLVLAVMALVGLGWCGYLLSHLQIYPHRM